MKNNVLLIYPGPDKVKSYRFGYSLLLLYIASDLRSHGYSVKLWDFSVVKYPDPNFKNDLAKAAVAIMEIDAFPLKRSTNLSNARTISNDIKTTNPTIPVIAVGKQCTLFNHAIDFVDTTIAGDSEITVFSIVDKIFAKGGADSFYDAGSIRDMSLLPKPAYDLLGEDQIRGKTAVGHMHLAPSALLETSRGCPGRCTFCQRKGWCDQICLFPQKSIRENFSSLLSAGIRNFWITDENFPGSIEHAMQTLKVFEEETVGMQVKISMSSWVHISKDRKSVV